MENESSNQKALKAGLGYTIGNILLKGITFLSIPVFSRLLSVSDYGIYNTFGSYVSVLTVIVGFALHASIKNAKYDYSSKLNDYCSSISLVYIFNCLLLLLISVVFSVQIGNLLSLEPAMVTLVILESSAMAIVTLYNDRLSVDYRYKEYLCLSLVYAIGGVVISVILILTAFADKRYLGRATGAAIASCITAIYILVRLFRVAPPKINTEYWKYGLKISIPLMPHGLSQLILAQFDRIMIMKTLGELEAGLYSFAYNVGVIYQVVANSLDAAWTPWFFEKMEKKDVHQIRKIANYYVGLLGLGATSLMLISPELIVILGGNKYNESRMVAIPIVLAMFYSAIYNFPAAVEYYYKKTNVIAVGTMIAAVLNIVLNTIFIPLYGFVAAAYTTVVCYLLYYFVHLMLSRNIHGSMIYSMKWHLLTMTYVTVFHFLCLILLEQIVFRLVILIVILITAGFFIYRKMPELKNSKD